MFRVPSFGNLYIKITVLKINELVVKNQNWCVCVEHHFACHARIEQACKQSAFVCVHHYQVDMFFADQPIANVQCIGVAGHHVAFHMYVGIILLAKIFQAGHFDGIPIVMFYFKMCYQKIECQRIKNIHHAP